jgi:hypothetical protein
MHGQLEHLHFWSEGMQGRHALDLHEQGRPLEN